MSHAKITRRTPAKGSRGDDVTILVKASGGAGDGVRDHSLRLQAELARRGLRVYITVLSPGSLLRAENLRAALHPNFRQSSSVILQHTHLMWSRTGIGLGAGFVASVIRLTTGSFPVVWLHDPTPFDGNRCRDIVRGCCQVLSMRFLAGSSQALVVSIPAEKLFWLPARLRPAALWCPSPSNLPIRRRQAPRSLRGKAVRIAFLGGTQRDYRSEVKAIVDMANFLQDSRVQYTLVFAGFGSEAVAREVWKQAPEPRKVELHGVLANGALGELIDECDLMVNVRTTLSARHGSVSTGLSMGLPVLGWRGEETDELLEQSGLVLRQQGDGRGLAEAILELVANPGLYQTLSARALEATMSWLAWDRVTNDMMALLEQQR